MEKWKNESASARKIHPGFRSGSATTSQQHEEWKPCAKRGGSDLYFCQHGDSPRAFWDSEVKVYGSFVSKKARRGLVVQMAVGPPHMQAGA